MVAKNNYFVQLGQKKNGRIVKNEQYVLNEFYNNIIEDIELISLNFAEDVWNEKSKIFKTFHNKDKFKFNYINNFCGNAEFILELVFVKIRAMIDNDTAGKKKNGKKKTI